MGHKMKQKESGNWIHVCKEKVAPLVEKLTVPCFLGLFLSYQNVTGTLPLKKLS